MTVFRWRKSCADPMVSILTSAPFSMRNLVREKLSRRQDWLVIISLKMIDDWGNGSGDYVHESGAEIDIVSVNIPSVFEEHFDDIDVSRIFRVVQRVNDV